jgi:hypothetical protein
VNVEITVDVTVADDADVSALGDDLFGFLCDDPDDLFPAIETVWSWRGRTLP